LDSRAPHRGAGYGDLFLVETVSNLKETNALFKYEKAYVNICLGNGGDHDVCNQVFNAGSFELLPNK
jgi:hypothetical protein